jgi:cation diffusion facilitator CzcD-associated flavoprotein CzcO
MTGVPIVAYDGNFNEIPLINYRTGAFTSANLLLVSSVRVLGESPDIRTTDGVMTASAFGGYSTAAPGSYVEIFGTGFAIDWAARPMLRHIAPHVRPWAQRWTPPADEEDAELSASPDLGPDFEFQLREGHSCPGLERIHCFCYPAALSMGVITGDIPAISEGALQLATGLAGVLYAEDHEHHFARMQAYAEPELLGDEWTPTVRNKN